MIDVNTATVLQLNLAIAQILEVNVNKHSMCEYVVDHLNSEWTEFSPVTEWKDGGPVMGEFLVNGGKVEASEFQNSSKCIRASFNNWRTVYYGDTPLLAMARAYVAYWLTNNFELTNDK